MVGPVPPPFGGIASVMEDIIHSDLAKDYGFEIFDRAASLPPYLSLTGRFLFRLRRFMGFFMRVLGKRYDLVHIHSADPAFPGTAIFMLLARLAGCRVLLHHHGTDWDWFYPQASPTGRAFIRLGFRLPHCILVLYSAWVNEIKRLCPGADVRVLGNMVRRAEPPDPEAAKKERENLGFNESDFVVLTVGSVGHRKGSFEILRAIPEVIRSEPGVRFVLVGGEEKPGEMGQLNNMIVEYKLEDWVRFAGEVERDRIPDFMAMADLFLLPSYVEGMPISIIEAMRAGLPVISTRVNAIPEMIEDGVSGLLIDPGSPAEIAAAIIRLKRDDALRNQLGVNSKDAFEERFEFSHGIKKIRLLYENVIH